MFLGFNSLLSQQAAGNLTQERLNRALDHPAIHIDGLAGNELGSVRGQKSHQIGDILRVAMMPQRDVLLGEPFDSLRP